MTPVERLTAAVGTLVADAKVLAATPDAPERHAGYARDILAAARHLAAVLAAPPPVPATLDLSVLAREAVAMADSAAAAKGIALAARGHAAACGDPRAVRQILANLVANAVKFVPQNGSISLTAGPGATVEVRDDGPGVLSGERERIFEPFRKGGHADGVGLGLSISRRLAREMGGDLTLVESEAGACFRLSLPPA